MTEERRKRTIGTARPVATSPLKRIPNFMNNPRREIVFSFGMVRLLVLAVARSGIRLPRGFRALGGKPGNYVGDFLVRHGLPRRISSPVRRSHFWTPGDHNRSQALVSEQR